MASVVMPSASPSKLRMIRCRRDGQGDRPDVVDRDVEPAVEQGVDLAGGHERLGAARRAAVADVVADELRRARLVGMGRRQHAHGVGGDVRRDRDRAGEPLHLDDLGGRADLRRGDGLGAGRPVHDRDQVLLGRERDHDLEQEAVELRLGQGIGALHLERVLGGQHEERRLERVALAGDRDLVLLHRLEQADCVFGVARLISSARTRLAKIGPGWKRKTRWPPSSMRMFVPVMSAGIRSGVNWMRLNEQSMTSAMVRTSIVLPRPGHALEQDVAVGEQAGQRLADELALADDDPADLALDGLGALGERLRREARVVAVIGRVWMRSSGRRSARRRGHFDGIERAEVVAHVVLDRERDVAAVERGLGVASKSVKTCW